MSFDLVEKTEIYTDEKTGKCKRRSPKTKNERVRQMLKTCVKGNNLSFRYAVADVWYASAENMRFVKLDLERDFAFPLKSNRKVALSAEDKQNGRFAAVSKLDLKPDRLYEAHKEDLSWKACPSRCACCGRSSQTKTEAEASGIWSPAM